MKSSPFLARNQRLERITTKTLVVGVDIAKESHVAQSANFRGIFLTPKGVKFGNNEKGFEYLLTSIRRLQKENELDDVIVGMESTGHYFMNLADWLMDHGIEVALVNPATTKRNKENLDNTPSKSDPKDAAVIADVMTHGYYAPYHRKDPLYDQLSILVKARERIVKDSGRVQNRIHGWVDLWFPELPFLDTFCPRSLATLHECPTPEDLAGLSPEDVVEKWAKHMSRPGGKRGLEHASHLLKVAKKSIGKTASREVAKWELQVLLEDYERLEARRKEVEDMIESLIPQIPQSELLESVGITSNTCAAILACAGDLRNFQHGNQLLRMAGLNLAEKTSGKYKGQIKLSKRGNSTLRKYLHLAVMNLVQRNKAFRSYHERNIQRNKMTPLASMVKLVGKLARILVAMARKNEPFHAEMATPLKAAS